MSPEVRFNGKLGPNQPKMSPEVPLNRKSSPEVSPNRKSSSEVPLNKKSSPEVVTNKKCPFYNKIAVPGLIGHGEKEKPQVRGCRTLVQRGTGRQDSPGRGDGLGWTTSTPPDSNGVPRDVPNVSRGHRARSQPTKKSVLTRKPSPHQIRMSVFPGPPEENQRIYRNETGGKLAHRSKPAKSRPDRPGKKSKPHGTEVGQNWVRYPQTDPDAPGCKGTLG